MKTKKIATAACLILALALLSNSILAEPLKEYKLVLDIKPEVKVSQINIEVKETPDYREISNADYLWEIKSGENTLNSSFFYGKLNVFYDNANNATGIIESGGMFETEFEKVELYIPYYENADRIIVYQYNQTTNEKTPVLDIDVSMYARNITPKEEVIAEGITGEKTAKEEIPAEKKPDVIIYLVAGIIIFVVAIIIIRLRKKKS